MIVYPYDITTNDYNVKANIEFGSINVPSALQQAI